VERERGGREREREGREGERDHLILISEIVFKYLNQILVFSV